MRLGRLRRIAPATALGVAAVLGFQGVAGGSGRDARDAKAPGEAQGKGEAYRAAAGRPGRARAGVDRLALKPQGAGETVLARQDTGLFGLLGVTWTDPGAGATGAIEARARSSETGKWSRWIALDPVRPGLDGRRPGAPGATEPVWVGPSNGAEVRVKGGAALPAGLTLNLVDPGTAGAATKKGRLPAEPASFAGEAAAPGPVSTAPRPAVVTRVGWEANESLSDEGPLYLPGGRIKAAFVHHTASAQPYDCSQSAAIVRGIHEYHVKVERWRDLGYNFLIDKCGTIFEGRQGGIDQPVQGADTFGWNAESMGIAVLGDHPRAGVSAAALESISRIAAYKLGQYGADTNGTTTLVAGADQKNYTGDSFTRGRSYPFKTVSGHRDGFNTICPGDGLYDQLATVRSAVRRRN